MADEDLGRVFGDVNPEAWARLGRYLDARCSPEERRAVEEWLAEDPRRQELVQEIRRARMLAEAAPGLWDVDAGWARLAERLDEEDRRTGARTWRRRLAPALRAAAAIAVLLGGAALWQKRATFFGPSDVPAREVVAGVGQQMRITLGDGTRVVLGPASRIRFPERFRRVRDVQLEGEAVFEVVPDRARPFRVRAGASVTEVLGTRFGVKAYPEDGYVQVVVAEGRVAVSGAGAADRGVGSAVHLTPGLAVRVESDGTVGPAVTVRADDLLAWTEGRLVFHAAPLAEVARSLGRRFGVQLELAEPELGELRLTAEFRQPAAEEAVQLIARSLGLGYRRTPAGFLLFRTTPTATGSRAVVAPLLSTDGGSSR
ncbi:MAG TPA: FecR domain-containing protein [Longimicrobiales bacterium]